MTRSPGRYPGKRHLHGQLGDTVLHAERSDAFVLRFPYPAHRAPLHSEADCVGKLSLSSRKRQLRKKKTRSCIAGLLDFQREQ
jgi:hypothetical protein